MTENKTLNKVMFYTIRIGAIALTLWLYYKYGRTDSWLCQTIADLAKLIGLQSIAECLISTAIRILILLLYMIIAKFSRVVIKPTLIDMFILIGISAIIIVTMIIAGWTLIAMGHFVYMVYEVYEFYKEDKAAEEEEEV